MSPYWYEVCLFLSLIWNYVLPKRRHRIRSDVLTVVTNAPNALWPLSAPSSFPFDVFCPPSKSKQLAFLLNTGTDCHKGTHASPLGLRTPSRSHPAPSRLFFILDNQTNIQISCLGSPRGNSTRNIFGCVCCSSPLLPHSGPPCPVRDVGLLMLGKTRYFIDYAC